MRLQPVTAPNEAVALKVCGPTADGLESKECLPRLEIKDLLKKKNNNKRSKFDM